MAVLCCDAHAFTVVCCGVAWRGVAVLCYVVHVLAVSWCGVAWWAMLSILLCCAVLCLAVVFCGVVQPFSRAVDTVCDALSVVVPPANPLDNHWGDRTAKNLKAEMPSQEQITQLAKDKVRRRPASPHTGMTHARSMDWAHLLMQTPRSRQSLYQCLWCSNKRVC